MASHKIINKHTVRGQHTHTQTHSLEVIRVINVVNVIDCGLQMIGSILNLLQFPRRVVGY